MVRNLYTTSFIQNLESLINKLDKKDQFNLNRFLNLQFFGSISIVVLLLLFGVPFILAMLIGLAYAAFLYFIGIVIPMQRRTRTLEQDAIIFFETLALSLESGSNLEQAITVSVENLNSGLSQEFKLALMDMRFGKTLEEALQGMNERIPSKIINNTIINIHQSLRLGSSITASLYSQISYLQEVEVANLKKMANTIPTKISVISVILFIPLILLLILGPVLITFLS